MDWIRVTDKLPENDDTVLMMWEDSYHVVQPMLGYFEAGQWYGQTDMHYSHEEIKAWMPIPAMTLTSVPALVPDVANDTPMLDKAEQSYNTAGWTTERKDEQSILFSKPAPIVDNEIDIPINWDGAKW